MNALQTALIHQVLEDGGRGVEHAHKEKMRKYQERCSTDQGVGVHTLGSAVDNWGSGTPCAFFLPNALEDWI